MPFDNQLFALPFFMGIIFLIGGFLLVKFPPKKINGFYGYRTPSSMKNQERWDFAQVFSGKKMIKYGAFMLVISMSTAMIPLPHRLSMILGIGVILALTGLMIYNVEKAIKNEFD